MNPPKTWVTVAQVDVKYFLNRCHGNSRARRVRVAAMTEGILENPRFFRNIGV